VSLGLLLELPTQRENVELARRAEAAGFGSAWAPEFHNGSGPDQGLPRRHPGDVRIGFRLIVPALD